MSTPKFISQAEFARYLGQTRGYITQLKQAGRIVITADGKVDVKASEIRIAETSDPNRDDVSKRHASARGQSQHKKTDGEVKFADARAKEMHYKSLQAELEYKKSIGELVSMKEMSMAVADLVTTFRQSIENIPHRVAPDLIGQDLDAVRRILKNELHHALSELERGCAEKINAKEASDANS